MVRMDKRTIVRSPCGISSLRNVRRDAQISTLTQRSRPISLIELGVPFLSLTETEDFSVVQ